MITRPATPADVPALVALVNSAYRGESSRAGWTTEADLLDGQRVDAGGIMTAIASGAGIVILVAETPTSRLVGCSPARLIVVYLPLDSPPMPPDARGP